MLNENILSDDEKINIEKATDEALDNLNNTSPHINFNVKGDVIINHLTDKLEIEIKYLKELIAEKDEEIGLLKSLLDQKSK